MSSEKPAKKKLSWLNLDVWSVISALLLAVLVRAGVVKHVPW